MQPDNFVTDGCIEDNDETRRCYKSSESSDCCNNYCCYVVLPCIWNVGSSGIPKPLGMCTSYSTCDSWVKENIGSGKHGSCRH